MFGGELRTAFLRARAYGSKFKTLILACACNYPIGDKVGADNTETYFMIHNDT